MAVHQGCRYISEVGHELSWREGRDETKQFRVTRTKY